LNRPAELSDTEGNWVAANGVDGNIDTFIHSKSETGSSWTVDLQALCSIYKIRIHNRQKCCHERLNGAVVSILDDTKNIFLAERTITDDAPILSEFDFQGIEGRYVRVTQDSNYLNFAEVEVYGSIVNT